jgi:hypothetical protein
MSLMHIPESAVSLERDLRRIFGSRLQSVVVYGARATRTGHDRSEHPVSEAHHTGRLVTHTMAVVDELSTDDLRACSSRMETWEERGLATPLLVAASEFGRALDVFPFEFGAILNDYILVAGSNPFEGLSVHAADLRRACEVEARGHLLHLREGYLETCGRGDALAVLIVESAPAFATLVTNVAHLDGAAGTVGAAARHVERKVERPSTASQIVSLVGVNEIASAEAERLFAPYLDTVQRLVAYIDTWKA